MWNINGTISGVGGNGATVTLSGAANATTTADASGNFTFSVADGVYTVTPSKAGFDFTPLSQNVTVSGADASVSFSSDVVHHSISGTISGAGANGVTMTLSGDSTATTTTDAGGNYTFSVADGSYTVTPNKLAYEFTPPNQNVTVSGAAVSNVNFTAVGSTGTSTLFHDDFNRAAIGGSYDIGTTGSYAVPVLDGATFGTSNQDFGAVALVKPAAAAIAADQFARVTLVNVSKSGGSSLFLRATLLPDGSDLLSGYEVDFGHTWNNQGDWWNVYYKDPIAGWQTVKSAYPSPTAIPAGSVVEFRAAGQMLQLIINGQVVWTGLGSVARTAEHREPESTAMRWWTSSSPEVSCLHCRPTALAAL